MKLYKKKSQIYELDDKTIEYKNNWKEHLEHMDKNKKFSIANVPQEIYESHGKDEYR